ncbi:hypothetical protein GH714_001519 [Hevea brasiliensis]|uniref:Reverse transcriptase Ty1/copia-type domain-containing protein n=1 Tax=Hevea brasiliensis TaxID=3981 RepID=A0A6A6N695_HEVBR|nr:hypothetical protein GH714_001519 [Hevea brasiliensis]
MPPGFVSQTPGKLNILVYVDDLIISGSDETAVQRFKDYLNRCFHMKDLGKLKYFLRIEVARNPDGIFLCQHKYALDIISEVGLLAARPANTPLEQNHKLALATGDNINDPSPKKEHWDATLRVVHYLKRNLGQGILLRANCDLKLYAYCDSDWAASPLTR